MIKDRITNKELMAYLLPSVIVFAAVFFIQGEVFEDDAFIFYRYAVNWASGHGPVFNVGEFVEGYSSLLWTALLASASYFSADLEIAAPLMNLAIGVLCLFFMGKLVSDLPFSRRPLMAAVLPLFCALSYGFYYYAASGMDALIFALVILISVLSIHDSVKKESFLMLLLPLTLLNLVRAEGFMYSFAFLAVTGIYVFIKKREMLDRLLWTVLLFFMLTAAFFILRYSIYNEWMPATVSAKGYASHLLKICLFDSNLIAIKKFLYVILGGLIYESFLFYLGAWIPFVMLLFYRKEGSLLLWLIAAGIFVNVFVSVWAGGDYFPYKRHFIPALPITIVFMAWALDLLISRYWEGNGFRKVILSIMTLSLVLLWVGFFIRPVKAEKTYFPGSRHTMYLQKVGETINSTSLPTVLLTNMIGKLSYHAGPEVYVRDILGLTDIQNAKHGETWGFRWGKGSCGRTDYNYSYNSPFDIFLYNSSNQHRRFIDFCNNSPLKCRDYRFLKSSMWPDSSFYIVANIKHPASAKLMKQYDAVPLPINDGLRVVIDQDTTIIINEEFK